LGFFKQVVALDGCETARETCLSGEGGAKLLDSRVGSAGDDG